MPMPMHKTARPSPRRRGLVLGAGASLVPGALTWAQADATPLLVTDFGADPTGRQDSTEAINKVLTATMANGKPKDAGRTVRIPKGTYRVSGRLKCGTHQHIEFEPGVVIDGRELPDEVVSMFSMAGQDDVRLVGNGARLIGSRDRARKEVEGAQAGIFIYGSTNVFVSGFILVDFATDGITVAGEHNGQLPCRNVVIENCHVINARRNGLSIIDCIGCEVRGGTFERSNGAPHGPWAGIDVEPDENKQTRGVRILNVTTMGNAGAGVLIVPGAVSAHPGSTFEVEVSGGSSRNDGSLNGLPALRFACGGLMPNQVAGQVSVHDFVIQSPRSRGVGFTNWDADKAPAAVLQRVSVIDPDGTGDATRNENRTGFLIESDHAQASRTLGNIQLIDCSARDTRTPPRMVRGCALASEPGHAVKNVVVSDFVTTNAASGLKYDVSTVGSQVPGGLVNVDVRYKRPRRLDLTISTTLAELGGMRVVARAPNLQLPLPPAANCVGTAFEVVPAPGIPGTTVIAASGDTIAMQDGKSVSRTVLAPRRVLRLRSAGPGAWREEAALPEA